VSANIANDQILPSARRQEIEQTQEVKMEFIAMAFLELFGDFFSKTVARVFIGTAVFFLPFLLIAIWLWTSDSNLWIFASAIASKILAVIVLLLGVFMALNMLWVLAEGNSARHYFGDVE